MEGAFGDEREKAKETKGRKRRPTGDDPAEDGPIDARTTVSDPRRRALARLHPRPSEKEISMSRFNEVKVRQTSRRLGLPQLALLTGAFVTAVILTAALRPSMIPFLQLRPWGSAVSDQKNDMSGQMERDEAQEKLAEAMARFAGAGHAQPEAPAQAAAPAPAPVAAPVVVAAPAPAPVVAAPPAPVVAPMAALPPPVIETPVAPAPVPAPVYAPAPAPAASLPALSEADMRRLNGKAAQAIRDGDILGARLTLERTIEGGDANALLALAETYDPKALIRMNAKGVKGDAAHARKLYTQALARGVTEARGRLEALDR